MISKSLVKYVLTAAFRDRLVLTLGVMILVGAALSVFLGSSSLTEKASFALVFGAGGLRLLGVVGIVLFCCFYVRRSFETKEVEFLLSRPISRVTFLCSHAAAFAVLSTLTAVGITVAVSLLGRPDMAGLAVWGVSVAAELAMMALASLFFSMVLSSAAGSALATLGLYVWCRIVGTLLGILSQTPLNWVYAVIGNIVKLISIPTPRLDMMGQTTWLVYGVQDSVGVRFLANSSAYSRWMMEHMGLAGFILLQGAIFSALILAAAAYDFSRRRF